MNRALKIATATFATLLSTVAPLSAASSDWADLGGGKARLVADFNPQTGKLDAAIEVKLIKGWSTYWRYPGSTGIPPMFDFSASQNVSLSPIEFPSPSLQVSGDARYAGYKNSVVFPLSGDVSSNQSPTLNLDMLIGVCEEICIPAKANFTITPDQFFQSDPVAKRVLSFAKLKMPTQMKPSDVSLKMNRLNEDTLEIGLTYPLEGNTPALFAEGPSDWYLTPAEFKSEADGRLTFHLDLKNIPKGAEVTPEKLALTFVAGTKGIEIRD